jgi:hypothetical protein
MPNASKFKSVIIRDYEEFTDSAKAELSDVDVCIWYASSSINRAIHH